MPNILKKSKGKRKKEEKKLKKKFNKVYHKQDISPLLPY